MLVLSARCSGADEIPIDRAEQSSTYFAAAANAIDGDLTTRSKTYQEDPAWLRVYFLSSSDVEKVVIEKGYSKDSSCVFTVSVYDGEVETVCGTYTGKAYSKPYYNETVQCGGKRGDSVRLGQTGCERYLLVYEIKVYGESNVTKCSRPTITNASLVPDSDTIASGASYTVTCQAGFTLKKEGLVVSGGSNDLLCLSNGSLSAPLPTCEASVEIPLDRAELSSVYDGLSAVQAIDSDLATQALTIAENPAWLRLYFKNSSNVGKVVIQKGRSHTNVCTFTVSVYDGEVGTVCGTYTGKHGYYYNETVQCGGKRGDSVMLKQTGFTTILEVYEIKVYGEISVTKCSRPTITNASLVPDSDTIASGASYTVTCKAGFTLKKEGSVVSGGSTYLLCLANGSLSAPSPTCEAVTCSKPDITNAVLAPTSDTIASGASYTVTCNEGTVMSGGSAQLLCTDEGSFSASLPSCEATGDLISLDRAEQSSTHEEYIADRAIDSKPTSRSYTKSTDPAWLRVYFQNPSYVEQVVIEQGLSHAASCVFTVSVYKGEVETVCGTYTGKSGYYYNEMVQCGGKRGDSVRLEQTGCTKALVVLEIKVYGQLQGKYYNFTLLT